MTEAWRVVGVLLTWFSEPPLGIIQTCFVLATSKPMKIDQEKIISLRKERGWSQSRLATLSGLGERTIQRIEKEGGCSLESAMALASVFELTPKDLERQPDTKEPTLSEWQTRINWAGAVGMLALILCAVIVIDLTAKYPNWERISVGLVLGLALIFSGVSYGAGKTKDFLLATVWIVRAPKVASDLNLKIRQTKSMLEYVYIIGVASSLVCGLTILVHSTIDPSHVGDYLTFLIRPLVYAILLAELWLRPLKHRFEYLLQLKLSQTKEHAA